LTELKRRKLKELVRTYLGVAVVGLFLVLTTESSQASQGNIYLLAEEGKDSTSKDSLRYPIKDRKPYDWENRYQFDFKDPSVIQTDVVYDPEHNSYDFQKSIGKNKRRIGTPYSKSYEDFLKDESVSQNQEYFRSKSQATNFVRSSGLLPDLYLSPDIVDDIFGNGLIDIRPSGSAEVLFGGSYNKVENPNFTARQQRNGNFDFELKMQVNVTGQIGDRMKINSTYNTEATFEFENQMKLDWQGKEDDILKSIELGNVSLPLNGSLIQGGQSLFGVKSKLQFGRLTMTTILTQQKGETRETEVNNGAQVTKFDVQAHEYDVNKHFFVGQYFVDNYDRALANLPVIQSNVLINYIEVWVTNRANNFNNTGNLVALMDLGEGDPYNSKWKIGNPPEFPDNNANTLYDNIRTLADPRDAANIVPAGAEYVSLNNARQLRPQEFTFNERLGYVSLNQALNTDEVLAVAYEYSYNGRIYKVGEFARDKPPSQQNIGTLIVKMLKSTIIKTNLPTWDLMMKNIYSLGAYNMQTDEFNFNIVYADDKGGGDLGYLPISGTEVQLKDRQLNQVFNLDRMNRQFEAKPDGLFDLIEGVTIQSQQGRIIFPMREPFGKFLRSKFQNPEGKTADYYAFDILYDSTRWDAEQDVLHNKFFLRGSYKGTSSNQIRLQCFNIPRGSVKVTANGSVLTEGTDYLVDYTIGLVTIINEGVVSSGGVLKASCESNSLFNIQQKSLIGNRFDYKFSDKLVLGGTILHLSERPLTPKTNIGDEPLLNTIWGFDGTYSTQSRWLTRVVDKLPFIETKEISDFTLSWEFAQIVPHKPRSIGDAERGTSFIDDFEGAETPYDLKQWTNWHLASVPQNQEDLFPEAITDPKAANNRRSLLSWYTLDPVLQTSQNRTPDHLKNDPTQRSSHFVRSLTVNEVFPEKELPQGVPQTIPTLDLVYRPNERGPYNYNTTDVNSDGFLLNPKNKWAGVMRRIETTDFEAANIDYIEIWIMDPFALEKYENSPRKNSGQLYINLGSVSEDVLPDNRRSMENALPIAGTLTQIDTTKCALIGRVEPINKAFDNDPSARPNQDVGLDGLNDEQERSFFADYLNDLQTRYGANSNAFQLASSDPSSDNYSFYRDEKFDADETTILDRYKHYNRPENNSTLDRLSDQTPKSATTRPNDEDINGDNTLNLTEEYYQYRIDLSADALQVGKGYVTDEVTVFAKREDEGAKPDSITYYQLKIPVREYEKRFGGIQNFKSIRFMRMFMTGFEDSVVLRFVQMQMIRADWRRYSKSLKFPPSIGTPPDPDDETEFVVSTVNIEENSRRDPIIYREPPGIARELDPTQPQSVQQNEQSLSLQVCNLKDGDARGAFKVSEIDIRNYEFLKMFVHAEGENIENGDMWAFIRIGTDLEQNYYQFEIPLQITPNRALIQDEIWPLANYIEIELAKLYELKLERSNVTGSDVAPFEQPYRQGIIRVVGLPDLSQVRSMMVGVINPLKNDVFDNLCGEVWFNELRVTGIANKGGWAATARMVTKLADFGKLNASANYQTIGFGAIDRKLNQRNLEQTFQYDLSANFELGKFFPQKSGLTIPMFIGWTEQFINPKFYPLNPDILYDQAIRFAPDEAERQKIKETSQDYSNRYSLNFTNVKKNRIGSSKAHLWDIENFNASYSYSKVFRRNQIVEENEIITHRASLGYNFASQARPWEPFKKSIKNKKLSLIRDFNLGLFPNSVNFRFDVDRRYGELLNRSNDDFKALVPRFYDKSFTFNRIYGLRWNFTRNLKFDYNATVNAWVEEPFGAIDSEQKRDTIRQNFYDLGTMREFNQVMNLNYTVPFSKIKSLNWISASAKYSGNYNWTTAPPAVASIGNTIQNGQTVGFNSNFNFTSLYNKSKLLRKLSAPPPKKKKKRKKQKKTVVDPDDPDAPQPKKEEWQPNDFERFAGQFLMMTKQAQFSVTRNNGTTLPGFTEKIDYLGRNFQFQTPSWPFIMGFQNPELRYDLARDGFLTGDTLQNNRFMELTGQTVDGKATFEPFKNFRISLNLEKRTSTTVSSNFRYDPDSSRFVDLGLQELGQYSISFWSWPTAFDKLGKDYGSAVFDQFKANRQAVSFRLQEQEFNGTGENNRYRDSLGKIDPNTGNALGFGNTHQDVMLYSFLSAYGGKDPNKVSLNPFKRLPIPSWRISYNGLKDLFNLSEYFSNISISHAYSSTLNLNSFVSTLNYGGDTLKQAQDLLTEYTFQQGISLIERLTPVIGVDVTLKNGLTLKFEYKRDKNITLFMHTYQMIEQRNEEYVVGAGFRTSGVRLPVKWRGDRVYLENDLNFRFDLSIRDGVTVRRDIELGTNTAQAGAKMISIKPTVDYKISDAMNLKMFYTRNVNSPKTSQSYPTALTDFGISLRYTLQ
jgi:cell surface protein SprA